MKTVITLLAILLCLAGCGGSSDTTSNASPVPAKTTAAPKVSLPTACQLVQQGEKPDSHPYEKLISFVAADADTEQKQLDKAHGYVDQLSDIAKRSPNELAVQINAMLAATNELFDTLDSGASWNSNNFKAAGLDIASQCEAYFQ